MNRLKKIILIFLAAILFAWLVITFFLGSSLYGTNENWFYWIELAFVIYFIWIWKLKSQELLYSALSLTVLGAAINIIGWSFAEQILRASLTFWFLGILFSFKELKK